MDEINDNQEQAEQNPDSQDTQIEQESLSPEDRTSSFEKRQEARENRWLNIVRAIVGVLFVIALAYTVFVFTRPPLIINETKAEIATSTAKKPVAKGVQPGRVYIPRLGIDEAVAMSPSGTITQDDLLKGATFYNGETNKAGKGNCVIFGHSAVTSEHGAPFGAIGDGLLNIGDQIVLTDASNVRYKYSVTEIKEISANDFSVVQPTGEDVPPRVTIVTCKAPNYPKDMRLVVIAELQK
jgi:LPXTG-site transpeptidase (sortase) family protein